MKVFIKAGCPWCMEAEAYLQEQGFAYEAVDVRSDAAAMQEMIALSGQTLSPTLLIDGKVLADFDVSQLKAFLKDHQIHPDGQ